MTDAIILDAAPLSLLRHPNKQRAVVQEVNSWLDERMSAGSIVYLPEIADYEVRRELIRAGKRKSIRKLDGLQRRLVYLPIDTAAMR